MPFRGRAITGVLVLVGSAACSATPGAEELVEDQASAIIKPPVGPLDGGIVDPKPERGDPIFSIRSLGSRCVDASRVSAGAPVVLQTCNARSESQRIRVREVDLTTHDVELGIGAYCLSVEGKGVSLGASVVLETCSGSPLQRFALDGDAILVGRQARGERVSREIVLAPRGSSTENGTALVVASRELSDAELLFFLAADGSSARPTRGFVTVATEAELDAALTRGWGTVIEVSDKRHLVLSPGPLAADGKTRLPKPSKKIHEGVTLRGNRLRTREGGQIVYTSPPLGKDIIQRFLELDGHDVRITGLRLTGSSLSIAQDHGAIFGISSALDYRLVVDRNEMTAWTGAAVEVTALGADRAECTASFAQTHPMPRYSAVRVVKNSLHDNKMYGYGYGVSSGWGAFPLVQGNVACRNRHTIASTGHAETGYAAFDNLVLSDWPHYPNNAPTPDFDIHGDHIEDFHETPTPCVSNPGKWWGGIAGDYVEVGWNTFLGTNRPSFFSRGTPCRGHDIHHNVFMRQAPGSPICEQSWALGTVALTPSTLQSTANRFSVAPNPMNETAVGDFDGDGIDDVFVGTGTGWYFSSGARSEWRFLSRKSETAKMLRLGDFDGDGRTDVVTLRGAEVVVSWAGISDWQVINVTAGALEDLAVGDFDGDRVSDLFFANGASWYVAPGGRNWAPYASSRRRTSELRFADFTNDGRTDVLGINGGQWSLVTAPLGSWTAIGPARASSMDGLFVGDFDGDGIADIARIVSDGIDGNLQISKGGAVSFQDAAELDAPYLPIMVGRFDAAAGVDVVRWSDRDLKIASGGVGSWSSWARQDMR